MPLDDLCPFGDGESVRDDRQRRRGYDEHHHRTAGEGVAHGGTENGLTHDPAQRSDGGAVGVRSVALACLVVHTVPVQRHQKHGQEHAARRIARHGQHVLVPEYESEQSKDSFRVTDQGPQYATATMWSKQMFTDGCRAM